MKHLSASSWTLSSCRQTSPAGRLLVTLKRLSRSEGAVRLVPSNHVRAPVLIINEDDLFVIGTVVATVHWIARSSPQVPCDGGMAWLRVRECPRVMAVTRPRGTPEGSACLRGGEPVMRIRRPDNA
jgi:hypothetical protein